MQKKRNTKFKAIDFIVILICLSGVGLNIILFWNDLNRTLTKLSEKPIATVSYKYKAAQRKFLDRVLWDRIKQDSPVYNGDIIRTAELSEATVTFLNGDTIDLFENTLAQIFWNLIDLSGGDISIDSHIGNNAIVLSSGNNRIEVASGGTLNAKTGSSGQALNIMVLDGDVSIASSSGETQKLTAGAALSFLGDGTQEIAPMVAVLSPVPGAQILNNTNKAFPVKFIWKTNNFSDKEYVRIEITKDSSFNKIVYSNDIKNLNELEIPLTSGVYWWRVYPVSDGKETEDYNKNAASGKLNIFYTSPPRLITPAENYVYSYRTVMPGVRFLWSGAEHTVACRIEIADNPKMGNPVITRQLNDSSLMVSSLGEGTWYWRVTPLYPAGYTGTVVPTDVSSFIINKSGSLTAPVLYSPSAGSFVNIAKGTKDTYFSWKNESEAAFYTIEISKNKDISDPVIKKEVKENWFLYKANQNILQEGIYYYWRVYQTDSEGNSSPASEIRSFVALSGEVVQKTLFPPNNYIIAEARVQDIRFTWNTNLPFTNRFQVSEQSDFSSLKIDDPVIASGIQGKPMAVGEYYWRIFAEADDKTVTFATPAKHFSIVPPLPAPVGETPAQNSKVVVKEKVPVEFRWNIVPGAEYYQIKLLTGGTDELLSQYTTNTSISVLMDNFQNGNYRWTIQAFIDESLTASRRTSLLGVYYFNMKKLNPVLLGNPVVGHRFEGLPALRNPGSVSWSSPEKMAESRFILSKNSNPSDDRSPVMDIKDPSKSVKLIPLKEGKYYWTITGETTDGFDITAKNPSWFMVEPTPLLPAPGGRTPDNRSVIGPVELMQTRAIIFSWNRVEDANTYIFTLFQEGGKPGQRKLLKSATIEGTEYKLEDLSILDKGNFTWQVEAISKTKEGVVEQRGTVGQNAFTINLPQMTKPQADKPGTLYGK